MRTLKPHVAKVSTVCVEKIFAHVVHHSQRKFELSMSSSPNWLVVIYHILVLHSSKLRFIESECDLKMKALFIDVAKAFDSVSHQTLWVACRRLGIPSILSDTLGIFMRKGKLD